MSTTIPGAGEHTGAGAPSDATHRLAVLADDAIAAWGTRNAHDPTVVRDDDGGLWMFSTDADADGPVRGGVAVRYSDDLVSWTVAGWALDGVPAPAAAWSGAVGLWAPEVVRVTTADGPVWRLYYSASSFGSRRSAIGLAEAPHPAGPWTDRGIVVASEHRPEPVGLGDPNAIDAAVVTDGDAQCFVYGSFFGGIYALPLDPATGFVPDAPAPGELHLAPGTLLAKRSRAADGAVEGAYVVPRPGGGWAMIVAYDSLASTYHLRVGVADAVTGPYRDLAGHALTDLDADPWSVGVPVLSGVRHSGGPGLLAPGHASVLTTPERQLLVHHVRDADAPLQHRAELRRLVWTAHGWPLVVPQPWAGVGREVDDEALWPSSASVLDGEWELVEWGADPCRVQPTHVGEIAASDVVALGRGRFRWRAAGQTVDAVVAPAWDAVRDQPAWCLVSVDETGRVVAGTRLAPRTQHLEEE